jgi:hypothetical protein
VLQVLSLGGTVDEIIIEKHQYELVEVRAEHVVHQGLECRRGIGKAEWHHQEFIVAVVRPECHYVDVVEVHPHLVVPRAQVELGEEASPVKLVEQLVDHRDGVLVLPCPGVQSAIFDAETP